MTAETAAWMGLACALEPGQDRWSARLGDGPEKAWRLLLTEPSPAGERARRIDLEAVRRETALRGFRFVHPGCRDWPDGLEQLAASPPVGGIAADRPLGLWLTGPLTLTDVATSGVAVVGARAATPYGETVASELAASLAEVGTAIVSGGAFGIDAAAHRGALAVDGITVAVMACGLDQLYPRTNEALLRRIAGDHLLVSEYPPGTTPGRHRFLARNRLIAALSSATVIVEAAARSGARNTVAWAQALGRPVLAVPGPVTSALSVTPHRLIRDAQAALVTSADDVLAELAPLGVLQPPLVDETVRATDGLDAEELVVREAFPTRRAITLDELQACVGLPTPTCLAVLGSLAAAGQVEAMEDGTWRLTRERAAS